MHTMPQRLWPFHNELTGAQSDMTCHRLSTSKTHSLMQNCLPHLTKYRKYLNDQAEFVFKLIDQFTVMTFLT